jgi:hypothetical protein
METENENTFDSCTQLGLISQHYKTVMLQSAFGNVPTMIMVFVKKVQATRQALHHDRHLSI